MKPLYIKSFYRLLLCFLIINISKDALSAAPAARSTNNNSIPTKWNLKFLCWNTSWSLIEWKRALSQDDIRNLQDDIRNLRDIMIECSAQSDGTLYFTVDPRVKKDGLGKELQTRFTNELNAFLRYINDTDYDVICLQECPAAFCSIIAKKLTNKSKDEYTTCFDANERITGCCVIYKKSIQPHVRSCIKQTTMSESSVSLNTQSVRIKFPFTSESINVMSIHLKRGATDPIPQPIINKLTKEINNQHILLGDFNSTKFTIKSELGHSLFNKTTIIGDFEYIDYCLFKNESFIGSNYQKISDKKFIENTNQSHTAFTVDIMAQDLFDDRILRFFIPATNEYIEAIQEESFELIDILKKIQSNLERPELDPTYSCNNLIDKMNKLLLIKLLPDTVQEKFLKKYIEAAKRIIYINNDDSFKTELKSTQNPQKPRNINNANDIKQLGSFIYSLIEVNKDIKIKMNNLSDSLRSTFKENHEESLSEILKNTQDNQAKTKVCNFLRENKETILKTIKDITTKDFPGYTSPSTTPKKRRTSNTPATQPHEPEFPPIQPISSSDNTTDKVSRNLFMESPK